MNRICIAAIVHESDSKENASFRETSLKLESLLSEFKTVKKEVELVHYEKFAEIKRNIRMRRDTLKTEIDRVADEMVSRAKLNEDLFRDKIIKNKVGSLEAQIKAENKQALDSWLKQATSVDALRQNWVIQID